MTRSLSTLLLAFSLFFVLVQSSWAAPLTEKQVEQFVGTLPQVQKLSDKHLIEVTDSLVDPSKPFSSGIANMSPSDPGYQELVSITKKHGYSNLTQWAEIGDRVLQAYVLISMDMSAAELKQLQQQAEILFKSGMLPPEMTSALAENLGTDFLGPLAAFGEAEQDVPAVQPYRKQLDQIMNADE